MIKRGFTLIEILIVIAILGILTILAVYTWTSAMKRSHNSTRKADIERIRGVLQQYYNDKRSYPRLVGTSYVAHCAFGQQLENYLSQIPTDPKNKTTHCSNETGNDFHNFYLYFPQGAGGNNTVIFPTNFTLAMTLEDEEEFTGEIEELRFTNDQTAEPNQSYNFTTTITGERGR